MNTTNLSSIFVVIPAYNEVQAIQSCIKPLLADGYSVVVVDDGSSDGTWDMLCALGVYKLRHAVNLGQGAALQTGITYAITQGAEIIVTYDADGQHRKEDIKVIVEPILYNDADVVLGSRFLSPYDRDRENIPLIKRVLLRGAIVINGIFTGLWLTDAHNGLRAFSRTAAEKILIRENGYAHATEIILQLKQHCFRYVERPTTILYTDYSIKKGQSVLNSFNILIDIILRRLSQ